MATETTPTITAAIYELVAHACTRCQWAQPTRSCTWDSDPVGGENRFASAEDAYAAIPAVLATFKGTDARQYAVRLIGERYPL